MRYFPEAGLVGEYQFTLVSTADSLTEVAGTYTLQFTEASGGEHAVGDALSLTIDEAGEVGGDLAFGSDQRPVGADFNDKKGVFGWQKMEMAGRLEQLAMTFDLDSGDLSEVLLKIIQSTAVDENRLTEQ